MNYYCDKCRGTTYNCETCDNPCCPNQPCCGRPKELCDCHNLILKTRSIRPNGLLSNLYHITHSLGAGMDEDCPKCGPAIKKDKGFIYNLNDIADMRAQIKRVKAHVLKTLNR